MKTFVIDGNKLITQGCIVEKGQLLKYDIESDDETRVAGNIYKGKTTYVNHQKRIGFIDIGLDKKGMINFKDVTKDVNLLAGQDILVQVISDPYEEKGAKLTTELSFQGKYMVLLAGGSSIGISRKIESEEKRHFLTKKLVELLNKDDAIGVVIRTDAEKASIDELVDEFHQLKNQLNEMLKYRVLGNSPRLLREQRGLIDQYVKQFNPDKDKWITNDLEIYQYTIDLLGKKSVQYYAGHDLFDYVGCSKDIQRIRAYRLDLPSGGEIVVDYTEACTVIDVNSGKQRKNTPTHDVLYTINCEAMEMSKWLLEKGNIGGAIIIDLINVKNTQQQKQLIDAAKLIFKGSDCYIAGISALGFLEITRKRVNKPAHKVFNFRKPTKDNLLYEPNTLFYLSQFINEVRRLTVHHSGRHYKFLATPLFTKAVAKNELLTKEGTFYENSNVTIEIIEDVTLDSPFKITY